MFWHKFLSKIYFTFDTLPCKWDSISVVAIINRVILSIRGILDEKLISHCVTTYIFINDWQVARISSETKHFCFVNESLCVIWETLEQTFETICFAFGSENEILDCIVNDRRDDNDRRIITGETSRFSIRII